MREIRGSLEGRGRRFVVVASRFNELVTERLVAGAHACLVQHGVADGDIELIWVPGAWELPWAVGRALQSERYDAALALGCVIRGETPHFDYVAGETAKGLAALALQQGIPVAFGVLTTDTPEQALARAGGKAGNKGWDAAMAALELVGLGDQLGGRGK